LYQCVGIWFSPRRYLVDSMDPRPEEWKADGNPKRAGESSGAVYRETQLRLDHFPSRHAAAWARCSAAQWASAKMVSWGFTPRLVGKTEPSTTQTLS
jgi:hypothetical protein